MIVGDPSVFAIESEITRAYERPSWRGLGFFVIHVAGHSYGIKSAGQTMLGCSFDAVGKLIARRGSDEAPFSRASAVDIANAYSAMYMDNGTNETYFGMSGAEFTKMAYSVTWAPDGDEAFDDSSYVLQFDVDDRIRLIAFNRPDGLVDPTSLRDVWLPSDTFYNTLIEWRTNSSPSGNRFPSTTDVLPDRLRKNSFRD